MSIRCSLHAAARAAVTLAIGACHSAPALPVEEGVVPVTGGDQLYFRLVGAPAADTVVLLHGGPALSSQYLEAGFGELGRRHALLFYDQRGRGRSSVPRSLDSLSLARDVADLEELRAHFQLGPMSLVGHQWGAGIALKYTIGHPAAVRRIAFLSPMAHKADFVTELIRLPNDPAASQRHGRDRWAGMDTLDPSGYCRQYWGMSFSPVEEVSPAVIAALAPSMCDAPDDRLRLRDAVQRQLFLTIGTWNWTDSIPLLQQPTLVMMGMGEPALIAGARAWAGRLPDARLLVTGRSALFPWVDQGPAIRTALDQFLDGSWPEAGFVVAAPPDSLRHS